LGEYVGQYIGDYVFQVGVALVVLTAATAAWIISRRPRYVKSADYKRGIEALRLEFRRSIDEARATTTRRVTAIRENLLSVIKPIDLAVTDLNVRLARLEEHADAVATFMAEPQKQTLEEKQRVNARLTNRGGPALRDRLAAWLRWILGWITPPISPRLPA
jgi:hypothetical protein